MTIPNSNENINMKEILKDWISTNEIQKLSNVMNKIDTHDVKIIDNHFEQSLNDLTFSQLLKGINKLSSEPQINKTILKNLVVNLWKYDQKSNTINKDPQEYITLITNIVWWWNTEFLNEQKRYKETQKNYKKIADDLSKDQKLLNKYILWNDVINKNSKWNIANNDFLEAFKKDYPDTNLSNPSQCIVYLEQKVANFKKGVLSASNMLSLQENNLKQFDEQIKNNQELSNLIAEMNQLSLHVAPEINYQELKNKAINSIWTLSKIDIWLGQRTFDKILKQSEKDIRDANDAVLESVILTKLQEARWLSNHPMLNDSVKKQITSILDKIEKDLWMNINLNSDEIISNQKNISVDSYLNTTNTGKSLEAMWQDPMYRNVFNKVFDMWYQWSLSDQQLDAFKKILDAQSSDTLEFVFIDKNSKNPNYKIDKALSIYPHGERVIRITSKNEKSEIKYDYITFGVQADLNKELAQWLRENQKEIDNLFGENMEIAKLFNKIWENTEFKQFNKDQLEIAAYGWPEAIPVIFSQKWTEFIQYLKGKTTTKETWNNGQEIIKENGNLESILNACKTNEMLSIEEKDQYLFNMFDGIKWDKELIATYVWLINKDTSYMWYNFLTRKNISIWLQFLIGNDKLLKPDTDWDLVKNILTIQSTIQIEAQKPLTKMNIQEQLKKYVGVLFSHPIGKMVLGLLDNFFGWKWWLISKFGKIPGFADELNKQFKKEFSLNKKQVDIINSLDEEFVENEKWIKEKKDFYSSTEKSINDIKNEFKYDILLNEFFDKNWNIKTYEDDSNKESPVLDIHLLNNYFTKNKDDNGQIIFKDDGLETKISYSELFSVNSTTKDVSLKENVDTETLKNYLHHILLDESTIKAIEKADGMFKDDKTKNHFTDGRQSGIYSEAGYARFAAAYLMWGSKGDWKLHYVMSESPVDVDPKPKIVEKTKPDDEKIKSE